MFLMHVITDKTQAGEVTFDDGSTYSLTVSLGEPKWIDGSNITETFKKSLPEGWVNTCPCKEQYLPLRGSIRASRRINKGQSAAQ